MIKFTFSIRYLTVLLLILIFTATIFSQNETYSIPAKWELYSVTDKKVSFLMPRLPVLIEEPSWCSSAETKSLAAYNDGVVYMLKIISEAQPEAYCQRIMIFNEKRFAARVQSMQDATKKSGDYENNLKGKEIIKFSGDGGVLKLINDYPNRRWFEISVYGADEKRAEVKNFLASFKTEKSPTGIAIGQGAERFYGDEEAGNFVEEVVTDNKGITQTIKKLLIKIDDKTEQKLTIVMKPRAIYTDAARQGGVQGKVLLKVTFMANGAIGDISVVEGLKKGLTEQAVKAAQKIIFLPAQKAGSRQSVTKSVEYTFTIY